MEKLTHFSQIRTLGWMGNHAFDSERFKVCDVLIRTLWMSGLRDDAQAALWLMSGFGMGEWDWPTREELQQYIDLVG